MFRPTVFTRNAGRICFKFCRCKGDLSIKKFHAMHYITSARRLDIFVKNHSLQIANIGGNLARHQAVLFASSYKDEGEKRTKDVIVRQGAIFDHVVETEKSTKTFQLAIAQYRRHQGPYQRNVVEFIYAALPRMKEFGAHENIQVYKHLLSLFPEGKMVARSFWQREMQHFPKHQGCAIDLLQQMEDNGITPDDEMGKMMVARFGRDSHAMKKYQRMMYWMPKFKNMSPYPVPRPLPHTAEQLAMIALKRMCPDASTEITLYQEEDTSNEFSVDDWKDWIVSAQSTAQSQLISDLPLEQTLVVEGPHTCWLRDRDQNYFILWAETQRGDSRAASVDDDPGNFTNVGSQYFSDRNSVQVHPGLHSQPEGLVLGMCALGGQAYVSGLRQWTRLLARDTPKLANHPILFRVCTPDGNVVVVEEQPSSR